MKKVEDAARRGATNALAAAAKSAEAATRTTMSAGRTGGSSHVIQVAEICKNGARELAADVRRIILEYDQPNSASYRDVFGMILEENIPRLIDVFRVNARAARLSNEPRKEEIFELKQALLAERQSAIDEFDLLITRPTGDGTGFADHEIKMVILREFSKSEKLNKNNLLGRPLQTGPLENALGRKFTNEERVRAGRCIVALVDDGLLAPTYTDTVAPEDWIAITELGRTALKRGASDELDAALLSIDPNLIELRYGAWSAAISSEPDTMRQAAHSGRELITQVLHSIAPISEVKAHPQFEPSPESQTGVTRMMQIRFAAKKHRGSISDSDREILENAGKLLNSLYAKLSGIAHFRGTGAKRDLTAYLKTTELVLALLLLDE